MPINHIEALDHSLNSSTARACRRILFTYTNEPMEKTGYFHVDLMYGMGSGTLLKIEDKFFLLTAKHVLEANNVDLNNPQNESPFWIRSNSNPTDAPAQDLKDFLFPMFAWHISDLMPKLLWPFVDARDVILIELFTPFYEPDNFIKITTSMDNILTEQNYYYGQCLTANGYPFESNSFRYDNIPESYTHATDLRRHSVEGFCTPQWPNGWHIDLTRTSGENDHQNLNGMSGGCICNVDVPENPIKWGGMITSGSNKIIRFIPAYTIHTAILNYRHSLRTTIDPAVNLQLINPA
jgi:hypothetical protein